MQQPFRIDFCKPNNLKQLAEYLNVTPTFLQELYLRKLDYVEFYDVPKRMKGIQNEDRRIYCIQDTNIKSIYKSFNRIFANFIFLKFKEKQEAFPHENAYGFIKGRNIIQNASKHCGHKMILHADIEDFFPSISRERLKESFNNLGIKENISDILSVLMTVREDNRELLPQGFITSPMLANLVCFELDKKLSKLANDYQCVYTRYADDISISSNEKLPTKEEVENILNKEGFLLSERKFHITKLGQSHYVTGLSVSTSKPRVPRAMKKALRLELYYCKKFGIEKHLTNIINKRTKVGRILQERAEKYYNIDFEFNEYDDNENDDYEDFDTYIQLGINRIYGLIIYVMSTEKEFNKKLKTELEQFSKWATSYIKFNNGKNTSATRYINVNFGKNKFNDHIKKVDSNQDIFIYADEAEIEIKNVKKLALSLSIINSNDHDIVSKKIREIEESYDISPYSHGKIKKLHFTDASIELKNIYIDYLQKIPVDTYLAYKEIYNVRDYASAYLHLLGKLLHRRFRSGDYIGRKINLIVEQNGQIKFEDVKILVDNIEKNLKIRGQFLPLSIEVVKGEKDKHACLSIPDFMLGFFGRYIKESSLDHNNTSVIMFEQLRDKFRYILDIDNDIEYNRYRIFFVNNFI